MILRTIFGAILALTGFSQSSQAQIGSWADSISGALPRMMAPLNSPNAPATLGSWADPAASYMGNQRDWKLGVGIQNTDIGAVVTIVSPGSAAQQAGINVNDVIVSAGPSRLGLIDNRAVELAEEIRRYADYNGRINLVVLDSRTRQLRSINANLSSNVNTLRVSVMLRDNMQLPYNSYLTVQLKNVSQPYFTINGGEATTPVTGFGPYQVELNVDPRFMPPTDQYQLSAYVTSNGAVLYQLNNPINLNTSMLGQPQTLQLDRAGSAVSAGYPNYNNQEQIRTYFRKYLNREPSSAELMGWQSYLSQGNSLLGLQVGILSSVRYREMFQGNDSAYVQSMFRELTNRNPNNVELSRYLQMLQATGSPEAVARDIASQIR